MAPGSSKMAYSEADADTSEPAGKIEYVDLIDVMNVLQNKFAAVGQSFNVDLPQIVVIGGQSAGKSSVLETFVGKEFLPRGAKLVTRRPIIVQLIPSTEEYGVFLPNEDEKITDFTQIRERIISATNEECGPQAFSKNPISLKIYSPRVLKLTVVDLPGIIQVAVEGQLAECVQQVRDIVLHYITKEKTIILAVTPAAMDISNSDALAMAKIADPDGVRTIGVLTKLDLMDTGTDAREVLENRQYPLKRGWVGVVNRNYQEMIDGKDMKYMLLKEKDFFQQKCYCHMASRMGTPYLQKLLQKSLRAHIKKYLPTVRTEISQKLNSYKKELTNFEVIMGGGGPNARQFYMIKLIQTFCNDINIKVMGYSELMPANMITSGALINFKLYTEVQQNITSLKLLPKEKDVAVLIADLNGIRNSISVPALAVDSVCRILIEHFKDPLEQSVSCVQAVLLDAVKESATLIDASPSLRNELLYIIERWIDIESENTKDRLKNHVDAEMFYINLGHPDFDSSTCEPVAPPAGPVNVWNTHSEVDTAAAEDQTGMITKMLENNEVLQRQVKYVTTVVIKYLEIVQKQMLDIVIKYISFFLVKKVLLRINESLIPTIIQCANIKSLTEDYEDDFQRKEDMEKICVSLQEALDALKAF